MKAKQADETKKLAAANAARDTSTGSEWSFHNLVLGGKDQVIAQYGRDSDEAQAVGLKKKSERKPASAQAEAAEDGVGHLGCARRSVCGSANTKPDESG